MTESTDTPQDAVRRISSDQVLGRLIAEVRPDPDDQSRLFRARWRADGSPCVLKIELGDLEAQWMPAMAARCEDVVPAIRQHGTMIVDHDQPWLIMDDLPHRGRSDDLESARGLMRVAARFQQQAAELDLPTYPIDAGFAETHARAARDHGCPGPVEAVLRRARSDDAWLRANGPYLRCHGDVHPWNAVAATPSGPWRLIDPIPRTAHWAWDGAYAQMTSGTPTTPDLITLLADERARLGAEQPGRDQLRRIRTILLAWSSVMWWSLLPQRRAEPWWTDQVRGNLDRLARLGRE